MPQEMNGTWHCTEGSSNKFYRISYERDSDMYLCTWGAIGSSGTEALQDHDFVLKKHRGFAGKGYRFVRGSGELFTGRLPTPRVQTHAPTEPAYKKSRLESIDDEESAKPKEKKKDEEPKSRLSSVD